MMEISSAGENGPDGGGSRHAYHYLFLLAVIAGLLGALVVFVKWPETPEPEMSSESVATPETIASTPGLAPEMAAATPTPTPVEPPAPTRSLGARVVWDETSEPAPGAEVTVFPRRDDVGVWRALRDLSEDEKYVATTGEDGRTTFSLPMAWDQMHGLARHAQGGDVTLMFGLSGARQIEFRMKKGAEILGRVWMENTGEPVGGAEVRLFTPQGELVRSVESAEDGAYSMPNLNPARFTVAAVKGTLLSNPEPKSIETLALEPAGKTWQDLYLRPGASLTGVVVSEETGEPIAGATVRTGENPDGEMRDARETETDSTGAYRLDGLYLGARRVQARAAGYAHGNATTELKAGEDNRLNFALAPGGDVEVTARDEAGQPIDEALVALLKLSGGMDADSQKTDAEGRVKFEGVDRRNPGMLTANKDGYRFLMPQPVRFNSGEKVAKATLVLIKQGDEEGGYFAGTAADTKGAPLPGVSVRWSLSIGEGGSLSQTATDSEGKYTLKVSSFSAVMPILEEELCAFGKDWAPERVAGVTPGPADHPTIVDFVMKPGHRIDGDVVDEQEQPISGASVSASMPAGGLIGMFGVPGSGIPSQDGPARTDGEGHFTLEGLPAGILTLTAKADGYTDTEKKNAVADQPARIVMKPTGTIRGRVTDKETGGAVPEFVVKLGVAPPLLMPISTVPEKEQSFNDSGGLFELSDLDANEKYQVSVLAKDYATAAQKNIRARKADDESRLEFALERGQWLEGELFDADTLIPLADAQVVFAYQKLAAYMDWNSLDSMDLLMEDTQRARTGEDGQFRFLEGEPRNTLFIQVAGYERLMVKPAERAQYMDDGVLRVGLRAGASAQGVYSDAGRPIGGATISLMQTTGAGTQSLTSWGNSITDGQGAFAFSGLGGGQYQLMVEPLGGIPTLARFTRKFSLERYEQRTVNVGVDLGPHRLWGFVLNNGRPRGGGIITLTPKFEWDYSGFGAQSDSAGRYSFSGLRAGQYEAQLISLDLGDLSGFRQVTRTILINGDMNYDFEIGSAHTVTARFVFDDVIDAATRAQFTFATLQSTDVLTGINEEEASGIMRSAMAEIKDGRVSFNGRFQGNYALSLQGQGGMFGLSQIRIPQTYYLDNLEQDRDLGDIPVPATGDIQFQLAVQAPAGASPSLIFAVLYPPGRPDQASQINLRADEAEQSSGPIPLGTYEAGVVAMGFRAEPMKTTVAVTPGETAALSFALRPSGMIGGQVMQEGSLTAIVIPTRIRLAGPGTDRTVQPGTGAFGNPYVALMNGQDAATVNTFYFQNLAAGSYQLTIEAEGFETYQGAVQAAPGQFNWAGQIYSLKPK